MAVAVDRMRNLRHANDRCVGSVASQQMIDVFQGLDAPLRAFLAQQTRSLDDAEDLVQEIFLRLWRMGARNEIRSVKAFAFKMACNLVKDRSRRTYTRMMRQAVPAGDVQLSDMGEGEPSSVVQSLQMLAHRRRDDGQAAAEHARGVLVISDGSLVAREDRRADGNFRQHGREARESGDRGPAQRGCRIQRALSGCGARR